VRSRTPLGPHVSSFFPPSLHTRHPPASSANDLCRAAKRSTLSAQDVLRALDHVGLPTFSSAAGDALAGFKGVGAKARAAKAGSKRGGGQAGGGAGQAGRGAASGEQSEAEAAGEGSGAEGGSAKRQRAEVGEEGER